MTVVGALALTGAVVWGGVGLYAAWRLWRAATERATVDVAGRWIAVTGCDSGFGRGVVEALVARGAHVIAFCYTEAGCADALALGAREAPRVDLADEQAVRAAARDVALRCEGRLWALVHNAGLALPGFVEYQPLSFYRRVMEVNFFAPVLLTQLLLPCVRAAQGRVVLVSSVDGLVSLPGNAPYDASKFAIEAYADALRVELSLWDLPVIVVNPSTMRTPLAMRFFEGHRESWDAMQREDPDGAWQRTWPRPWLEDYIAFNARSLEAIAQDPALVVRDLVHALTARRPRPRYLSGTTAKTLFWALWVSPEGVSFAFKKRLIQPRPDAPARGPR